MPQKIKTEQLISVSGKKQGYWVKKENIRKNEQVLKKKGNKALVKRNRNSYYYTRIVSRYKHTQKELEHSFKQQSVRSQNIDRSKLAKNTKRAPVITAGKFFDFTKKDVENIDTPTPKKLTEQEIIEQKQTNDNYVHSLTSLQNIRTYSHKLPIIAIATKKQLLAVESELQKHPDKAFLAYRFILDRFDNHLSVLDNLEKNLYSMKSWVKGEIKKPKMYEKGYGKNEVIVKEHREKIDLNFLTNEQKKVVLEKINEALEQVKKEKQQITKDTQISISAIETNDKKKIASTCEKHLHPKRRIDAFSRVITEIKDIFKTLEKPYSKETQKQLAKINANYEVYEQAMKILDERKKKKKKARKKRKVLTKTIIPIKDFYFGTDKKYHLMGYGKRKYKEKDVAYSLSGIADYIIQHDLTRENIHAIPINYSHLDKIYAKVLEKTKNTPKHALWYKREVKHFENVINHYEESGLVGFANEAKKYLKKLKEKQKENKNA